MTEEVSVLAGETIAPANKHLELAYTHVCQAWFPVNPQLLRKIQDNIRFGLYDGGREILIKDLKQDYSLLTYCLKALCETAGGRSPSQSRVSPMQLLEEAPLEELKKILNRSEGAISIHRMAEMNDLQTVRLKHSMLSATVAEAMAEKNELDPEVGYCCAMFRQLGLTLIAWNYPHVYRRVLATLKPADRIDTTLSKMLGFSPTMLGITIARRWGIAPEIRLGMGDMSVLDGESGDSEVQQVGATLERICRAGEALARASDPDHYPSAAQDWDDARSEILDTLGRDGFAVIHSKLEEHCKYYVKSYPELFRFPSDFKPQNKPPPKKDGKRSLLPNNQYVKHCPAGLQAQLKELYESIDGVAISKNNVDRLAQHIIPRAGFIRGCVYLVEPDSLALVPRLVVGGARLAKFQTVRYRGNAADFDPIVAAFRCQNPIMEDKVVIDGEVVSYVAGGLGEVQKAGVLYLEVSEELLKNKNVNVLLIYKAVRQALNDCLNLK